MGGSPLVVRAGPAALRHLERDGLAPEHVRMLVGASGGAKWLSLVGLDHALVRRILPGLTGTVHLLGSSIGTWRFACYANADPAAALRRFERAYIDQTYSRRPDAGEITTVGRRMIRSLLGESGVAHALAHPVLRMHLMTVRAHHLTASESAPVLATGLTLAMLANRIGRRHLRHFFSRALVSDPRAEGPFHAADDFPMERIELTQGNFEDAVLASSAIPFVMHSVRGLGADPRGVYRDGGIIDYHFDVPLSTDEGITLYPHFYPYLTPGWFDKSLNRQPRSHFLDRVILLAPSAQFVAGLPHARIPDRGDFKRLEADERIRAWRQVVAETERLGEAFEQHLDRQDFASVAEPLVSAR